MSKHGTQDDLHSVWSNLSTEDSDVLSTFSHLEALVKLFGGYRQPTGPSPPLREHDSAAFKTMLREFDSIRHAKLCYDLSSRRVWQWREAYLQRSGFSTLDFGESEVTHNLITESGYICEENSKRTGTLPQG